MSKKIATYEDLLEEKARLEELLQIHKKTVDHQFTLVKSEVLPAFSGVANVFMTLSRMGQRPKQSPLVYFGIDLGTQMILKRWLSMKTGWIARTVIPFVVRYYVSKFVSDKGDSFLDKLKKKFTQAAAPDKKDEE